MELVEAGRARRARRRADRRQRRGHRHRRGPRAVQGGHDRDRPRRARLGHRPHPGRGPARWSTRSACRSSSARPTSSAGGAPASPPRPRSSPAVAGHGLDASPISEILIEQSIAGWKEYELEVMRDRADNCVVICSIENLDPMGVHTGDSITVAPAQTLSDVEYQLMRDAAFACIRRVGVETGGSNVQFALDPTNGDMVIIEMNPRVSRSSALASKATGFPIAKIAARLAVGYTLDEIPNDITEKTPASFEPTHRLRRHQDAPLGVREVPGPARRARHPDAVGGRGHGHRPHLPRVAAEGPALARARPPRPQLRPGRGGLRRPRPTTSCWPGPSIGTPDRPFQLEAALRRGHHASTTSTPSTKVDPWFLDQISAHRRGAGRTWPSSGFAGHDRARDWRRAKRLGFADAQLAWLWGVDRGRGPGRAAGGRRAGHVQDRRHLRGRVRGRDAVPLLDLRGRGRGPAGRPKPKVVILGSGPNRIGQGIEFDYCCVHASFALRDAGFETIMVNCNPETVSTDYDTSDRLYFEPLTYEDVLNVIEAEQGSGDVVGRHRGPRRPDPAQAGRRAARGAGAGHQRRRPSTWPRTASAGTPCAPASRSPSPPAAPRPPSRRPWPSSTGSATRC